MSLPKSIVSALKRNPGSYISARGVEITRGGRVELLVSMKGLLTVDAGVQEEVVEPVAETPAVVADAPVVETPVVETPVVEDKVEPVLEGTPDPDKVPDETTEPEAPKEPTETAPVAPPVERKKPGPKPKNPAPTA